MGNFHVVPHKGEWTVRGTGTTKASRVFSTQKDAISFARGRAKSEGGELYIHRSDGMIRERNSYGADPLPPRG